MLLLSFSCNKKGPLAIINEAPIGSEIVNAEIFPVYSINAENYNFIGTAMDYWNDAAGRELLVTAPNDGFPIRILWVEHLTEVLGADPRTAAYSWRSPTDCMIELKIKKDRLEYDEIAILIHEIGHCIGFGHSNNPQSYMYFHVNPNQNFTTEIIRFLNE